VKKQCDGHQSSCDVSANNGIFGDPCPGTYKYLKIGYECQPMKSVIVTAATAPPNTLITTPTTPTTTAATIRQRHVIVCEGKKHKM
jgi:hypothetical protein